MSEVPKPAALDAVIVDARVAPKMTLERSKALASLLDVGPAITSDGRFDAQALVDAVRSFDARPAVLAWMLAEVHLGDGDELGEIARELWAELRARADAAELERAAESFRTASDAQPADPKS